MRNPKRLSGRDKKQLVTLIDQASRAFSNGRFDICRVVCDKIDKLQPDNPDAANFRGILYTQAGDYENAILELKKAVAAAPARSDFLINLAGFYSMAGQNESARYHYLQALALNAKSLAAKIGLGNALIAMGRFGEAIEVLQQARARHPHNTDVLMRLFQAHYELLDMKSARQYLHAILELDPQHTEAHRTLGRLWLEEGNTAEAEKEIRCALAIDPLNVRALDHLADLKRFESLHDADIVTMQAIHAQKPLKPAEHAILCFALGKAMDKLTEYDQAFNYYREGNDIRCRQSTYHPEFELQHLRQIMQAHTPEAFNNCSNLEDASPIFIIGMPRCGSTLTEQILVSHPDVSSKGEWGEFEQNLGRFSNEKDPLTLEKMVSQTPDQWQEIGRSFLERMKVNSPRALRIIDKSLNNIRFVGAIHCALPKAKIIHVRRNPLDTCLSIYKSDFQGRSFDFGCDLEELGHYYHMYLNLMQHWREVLPAGTMCELDYERLVADQETETRNLLNYCGLEWDERCLQFNKVENLVRTASITQVRRPIYTDSLAAWKRYEKHLQPLIDILGPEYSTDYQVPG